MLRGISISQLWKGLESPFLHSGLSLMALYQNPEFRKDRRWILNPEDKKSEKKKSNLTILTLLLNLTDANIVFNGVRHIPLLKCQKIWFGNS